MSKRRITNLGAMVEYKPGKYRRITNLGAMVEYKPSKRRRITNVAAMVEYKPGLIRTILGLADCPICFVGEVVDYFGQLIRNNPVGLQSGEKFEEITDLSLNTPAGPLTFTRHYRQAKQGDSNFQELGLGWKHNHNISLTKNGTVITVRTPSGSEVFFRQTVSNQYEADPGSGSDISYNTGTSQYTMTNPDGSKYVFDNAGKLLSRIWPNNEVWSYSYNSGKLSEVNDGYNRKLVFRYHTSGSHMDKLYRVGDHTFDDSDPMNPTGRYVEFSYILNKVVSGSAILDGTSSLLSGVTDVRGHTWTYNYYGQDSNETDVRQLNFLTERQTPSVDTTGDGTPDGSLTLEQVTYTMQGEELAVNGDMELDSGWNSVGTVSVNEQSTAQVDSGTYARHVVVTATNAGIEGSSWDLVAGKTYVVTARVYPVAGTIQVKALGNTNFTRNTSGSGAWETLRAVYTPGSAASGLKLQFLATALVSGSAEFYVDSVSIIESDLSIVAIDQERGEAALVVGYAFQPGGENITEETVAGRTTTHYFNGNTYQGTEDPEGHINSQELNLLLRPDAQTDANGNKTAMTWSKRGRHLNKVTNALNQVTRFSYNSDDTLKDSTDAEGRKTEFTYGDIDNPRLPTRIKVFDTDGTTVLRWQAFEYDDMGRALTETTLDPADGTTLLQQVTREYYTSGDGNGLLHTLTQIDIGGGNHVITTYTYDSAGRVIQTQQNSNFGSCEISYTVYDIAGNVVASICNYDPGMNPDPTDAAEAAALYDEDFPDQNRVTTYTYDTLGRRIETTINAGASFAQTTVTVYDALNRVIRTIANYQPGVSDPYTAAHSAFDAYHGVDNTENLVTDTAYNQRGLVKRQTDVLGNVTLLGYDDAGRLVKTVQNASTPGYNNDYSGDPDLSAYTPGSNPDEDIISQQEYDAVGNLVKAVDALGHVHFTVYDALNRPVKTVRSASDPDYDIFSDPDLSAYTLSTDPDQDMTEETEYDTMGRVIRTKRLLDNRPTAQWSYTLLGYDPLGRQVKVVSNASNPSYDMANDPDLSGYSAATDADLDIITQTVYDANGRVESTEDALGAKTYLVYDGLNRQVLSIANYVPQATDPVAWVWDAGDERWEDGAGNAIAHGVNSTDNDQNIISQTIYNSDGRVQSTRDVLGRMSYTVYDSLGRTIRAISNYVPQGATNPANWVWDAGDNRWEDAAGNAISFGSDNDQNRISETSYDAQGRVQETRDHRYVTTRFVYDILGRQVKTIAGYVEQGSPATNPANWVWDAGDNRWEDGAGSAIDFGADNDQNRITENSYDEAGRVTNTRDALGIETQYEYDDLGRRVKTTVNYVDGAFSSAAPDEDLISTTVYNRGGQVVSTTDARGTKTAFTYDDAGRRLTVTRAADTALAVMDYTCYDKAGRVLRTIANWIDDSTSPDAQDGGGEWLFNPASNGTDNDQNLVSEYTLDQAGRVTAVADPLDNTSSTSYFKDGQVKAMTDPEGTVTHYRYDGVRRRTRVVQGFVDNGEDPENWRWDEGDSRWEKSGGTAIAHGADNDQNVIVLVEYDTAGRVTSRRDPNGHLTTYAYDLLNRRQSLTNPISKTWTTVYTDLSNGGSQTSLTYPGINGGSSYTVLRDFDRLGRLASIAYGDPANTPDVQFAYTINGSRAAMTEFSGAGFTSPVRETQFSYDDVRRLTSVGFDNDGGGTVDESVSYQYDAGGLRTKLTLPGSLDVTYTYNTRGELTSLTDWDSQQTDFSYDDASRLHLTERPSGLDSRYHYDAAGRLRFLRHYQGANQFQYYKYQVDKRGNRTQAFEEFSYPSAASVILDKDDSAVTYPSGTWADSGDFKTTIQFESRMKVTFTGKEAALTVQTGPDHSLFDVYIDGSLWQSFDGYAASSGERDIEIALTKGGIHVLNLRNRAEKNPQATTPGVYCLGFKQVALLGAAHTIDYTYDALSRLLSVDDGARRDDYTYDLAGNRLSKAVTLNGGSPTTVNYTYNAANQLTSDGTNTLTYDHNGNLTDDGPNSYTWDRANRLLSLGGASYAYDGMGNRVKQTVGMNVTQYLLDLQPGLAVVLSETQVADTTRYLHGPRGIHAHNDASDNWEYMMQDGLGSVRGVVSHANVVLESRQYDPIGNTIGTTGTSQTSYGFTGEMTFGNLLHLRARDYNPALGVFTALDPFEGMWDEPLSLNGYSYVQGNPTNAIDPSGLLFWSFPRGGYGTREQLYDPDYYLLNPSDGSCRKVFAHSWIAYWLEENNGGIWKTQVEFPGHGQLIDEIVFEEVFLQGNPPLHQAKTAAYVYEVEPVIPTISIPKGFTELEGKFSALSNGIPPYSHVGNLPRKDAWNPERDIKPFKGAPYDWSTYVATWQKGHYLSPSHGRGPTRVDPNTLGGGGIPDAYWIYLPINGLILYVSECELRRKGIEITAAAIEAWILNRYMEAKNRYANDPRFKPLPNPGIANNPSLIPDWAILVALGVLCIPVLAPAVPAEVAGGTIVGILTKLAEILRGPTPVTVP